MRLKGINPIEQHVEKIVLGLVGVVFLGVVALQFLVSPNEVDYEGQKVPPDRVLTRLGDKAGGILGQMIDPSPELPAVETPELASRFESAFTEPLLNAERMASVALGKPFELEFTEVEALDGPVTPLSLPAPGRVLAGSQWSTVDPFFAAATPALDPYLPDQQPMDKVTVSVETVINGKEIEALLRTAAEGARSIPSHWWSSGGQGRIEVLAVELERQARLPDGSWGEPEAVESVRWSPGALEALNEGAAQTETVSWETVKPSDLLAMAGMAQDDPSLVAQPQFLPTIAGVEWVAPSKAGERQTRLETEGRIERLEREITEIQEQIAQVQDQQRNRPQTDPSSSSGSRNTGSLIIGGGPGGGGSSSRPRTQRADPVERRVEALNKRIEEKQSEIDTLLDKLDELDAGAAGAQGRTPRTPRPTAPGRGAPPSGAGQVVIFGGGPGSSVDDDPRTTGRPSPRGVRTPKAESVGPLLEQESYQVWSHDLTAEPGAVYRYRIRYGVNNPLFGREKSLGSEDAELIDEAKRPLVRSPWSAWSDPVFVGRESYFFVTSAREEGVLNQQSSSATAEVYRMYYGYYRKHTVTLEPGDAVQGEFRLPDDLPLFQTRAVKAGDLERYFAERNRPEDRPGQPPLGAAPADEKPVERPWLSMVPTRMPLTVDAVMLDVAEYPVVSSADLAGAQARRTFEVLFFDRLSGIVARRPDRDREMPEYAMVERSADLAETGELREPDSAYIP